ncbi:glutathione S-transferase-like [Porites lutea]|uniref:glutathione S-transferase-like n=1 Tax=Porites lutea TaxID=51062 RepID=UPI003CC59BF4
MSGYQLYYFPIRGRAEMARWAFAAAKIDFEDVRLSSEEWAKEKASGRAPFGQMPFLVTPEGNVVAQSGAIMKYICKKGGVSPSDSFDEALADMIHDGVYDLRNDLSKGHHEKDETKKIELMTKFFLTTLPERLGQFEAILKSRDEGKGFFCGDKLTYADISFVEFANGLKVSIDNQKAKGNPMPDIDEIIGKCPLLVAYIDRVLTVPEIKTWVEKRPDSEI